MPDPREVLLSTLQQAQDEFDLSPRSGELLAQLSQQPLSQPALDDLWASMTEAEQVQFHHDMRSVIVVAIAQSLSDHRVTTDERLTLRYLKTLFRIDDGELYEHRRNDLVDLLRAELATLGDEGILPGITTPHAVLLQELMGLSYDQFSELLEEARNPLGNVSGAFSATHEPVVVSALSPRNTGSATATGRFLTSDPDAVRCPKCNSSQITAGTKGFGLKRAAAGGLMFGPVGLLGGLLGSKKVRVSCLKCGHQWAPSR